MSHPELDERISANADFFGRIVVRNTFIEMKDREDTDTAQSSVPRSSSAPALITGCSSSRERNSSSDISFPVSPNSTASSLECEVILGTSTLQSLAWPAGSNDLGAPPGRNESLIQQRKRLEHESGRCKPCHYHFFKRDGCRAGDACDFCHFCTREFAQRCKQQQKRQAQRAKERSAAGADPGSRQVSSGRGSGQALVLD
eukprot:TRINITY_DN86727_c0_g1_i1.p1 TRINITY_DN86727_c0_g1~~TRINITY_DN86727_c0_g1_i1.p1  ORF type:complete len:200 (-),score=25.45 TRINITY_DN86727_c0_g1_i1:16-615(-)